MAAGSLVSPALAQAATQSQRPNILVFLPDDHARWAQHAYGNSELWTPNLDRLAAQGTRMLRAFATYPVCSPARASFFTGKMPSQPGIHDYLGAKDSAVTNYLAGQTLISESLKAVGYHTGSVGKWHCGYEREPKPGFDRWFSCWKNQFPHRGAQHFSDQGKLAEEDGQRSPFLTRQAVNSIRDHRQKEGLGGNPFFFSSAMWTLILRTIRLRKNWCAAMSRRPSATFRRNNSLRATFKRSKRQVKIPMKSVGK